MSWPIANTAAFAGSAQLNFTLSSAFTWRDRRIHGRRWVWRRWASYNATTLFSLAINGAVFTACHVLIGSLAAAVAGVAVSATVTYMLCNVVVFRARPGASWTAHVPVRRERVVESPVGEVVT